MKPKHVCEIDPIHIDLNDSSMNPVNYIDSYSTYLKDRECNITKLSTLLFHKTPSWVSRLLEVRNILVKPLGLRTSFDDTYNIKQNQVSEKDRIGLFKIVSRSENEIILGENDKHLNFRIVTQILSENDRSILVISTLVHFNNFLGKAYFFIIKPFHKIIVSSMIKNIS